VSYMVLYTGLDGATSFGRSDELPGAVAEVERLRNEESIEDAKIYRLEEVKFEIKPYFRVELPGSSFLAVPAPSLAEVPSMVIPPPPPPPPAPAAPMGFDNAPMVEEEDAGVGSRRGLFGR
jgi:hypothetical protein